MSRKVIIAMSGGVDSSVAALLMRERGYMCMGATMKLFHNEDVGLCRAHVLLARGCGGRAQRAVTCGQSVVLYDGDRVLGGGVIEKTF